MKIKHTISYVLFWSIISAAFIGPGTVTTAASAGALYGFDLIWVLVVSTLACAVIQISVTELTITSGKSIGELLLEKFAGIRFVPIAIGLCVVFGCAAYQAGNLLGATLGLQLIFSIDQRWIVVIISLAATMLLLTGNIAWIVRILGVIVGLMGLAFFIIALSMDFRQVQIQPISWFPQGSEVMMMGLIGTTIVPYNLFLGSGLSKGKDLRSSRVGLFTAIALGGLISIAILVVGSGVHTPFDFKKLSVLLQERLGGWANYLLGFGLFAAGFTSSISAPMAAVITMKSIFPNHSKIWKRNSLLYNSIWMSVMMFGVVFGFLNVKPIPVIIFAQASNGIILPFICLFLLILAISAAEKQSAMKFKPWLLILAITVGLIVAIGVFNFLKLFFEAGPELIISSFLMGTGAVAIAVYVAKRTK